MAKENARGKLHTGVRCTLIGLGILAWSSAGAAQIKCGDQNVPGPAVMIGPSFCGSQAMPCAPGGFDVSLVDGNLSVSLRDAKLREVLETISERGGIGLRLRGLHGGAKVTAAFDSLPLADGLHRRHGGAKVTAAFDSLPLADGLHRLLRGLDYAMVYAGSGPKRRIAKLFVSGQAGPAPVKSDDVGIAVAAPLLDALAGFNSDQAVENIRMAIADPAGERHGGAVLSDRSSEIASEDEELTRALLGGGYSEQFIELAEDLNFWIKLSIEEGRPRD